MSWPQGGWLPIGLVDGGSYTYPSGVSLLGPNHLQLADGSAAAPSLAFSSDADGSGTGLYRSGGNQIAFSSNGNNIAKFFLSTTPYAYIGDVDGGKTGISLYTSAYDGGYAGLQAYKTTATWGDFSMQGYGGRVNVGVPPLISSSEFILSVKSQPSIAASIIYIEAPNNNNHLFMRHDGTDGNVACDGEMYLTGSTTIALGTFVSLPLVIAAADVSIAADTLTSAAHGLFNGTKLIYAKGTTAITVGGVALSESVPYYVVNTALNTFQIALAEGGAALDFDGAGTGNHTFTATYRKRLRMSNGGNIAIRTDGAAPLGTAKLEIDTSNTNQGIYVVNSKTSGNNYGFDAESTGSGAVLNVGGYFYAANATTNYGIQIDGPASGANNYALYSAATAKSYFAGAVNIAGTLQIATATPATDDADGTAGQIAWDADYIYICVTTGTGGAGKWKRAAIAAGW